MKNNFFAVIEVDNKIRREEWFSSYDKALDWANDYDEDDYVVTIFETGKDDPVIKYERENIFAKMKGG